MTREVEVTEAMALAEDAAACETVGCDGVPSIRRVAYALARAREAGRREERERCAAIAQATVDADARANAAEGPRGQAARLIKASILSHPSPEEPRT